MPCDGEQARGACDVGDAGLKLARCRQAVVCGLVNKAVPAETLREATAELANKIAQVWSRLNRGSKGCMLCEAEPVETFRGAQVS